jgi:hypothetical protein
VRLRPVEKTPHNCATLCAHLVMLTQAAIFIAASLGKLEGPVALERVQCTQQPVVNALNAPA